MARPFPAARPTTPQSSILRKRISLRTRPIHFCGRSKLGRYGTGNCDAAGFRRGGPAFPEQLMPRPPERWVETILFGTVSDLKRLLDGGFDPKSAKLPGGTTALMMAAPDVPKMRVLIERGIDVNARSHDGYTALTVSARYGGADEASRSLLDAGACVTSPDDQSFTRLQVLGIAAHAGNWRSFPPL